MLPPDTVPRARQHVVPATEPQTGVASCRDTRDRLARDTLSIKRKRRERKQRALRRLADEVVGRLATPEFRI